MALNFNIPMPDISNSFSKGFGLTDNLMKQILERNQLKQNAEIEKAKQKQLENHFIQEMALNKAKFAQSGQNKGLERAIMLEKLKNLQDPTREIKALYELANNYQTQGQGNNSNNSNNVSSYPALDKLFSGKGAFKEGEIEPGNIDLNNRPQVANPETGGTSTVYSMSIGTPKGEVLIPRVSEDGRVLSEPEAIDQFHKTGKHLGIYSNSEEANKAAEMIHQNEAQKMNSQQNYQQPNLMQMIVGGALKKKTGVNPFAPAAQTPEQKQEDALNLFKEKEAIKAANKKGESGVVPLTTAMKTKLQGVVTGVDNSLPVLEELITNFKSLPTGLENYNPSAYAAYNAKANSIIEPLINAFGLNITDATKDMMHDQVFRKTNEPLTKYRDRLVDLGKEIIRRRNDSYNSLQTSTVNPKAKYNDNYFENLKKETKIINGKTYTKINGEWHE